MDGLSYAQSFRVQAAGNVNNKGSAWWWHLLLPPLHKSNSRSGFSWREPVFAVPGLPLLVPVWQVTDRCHCRFDLALSLQFNKMVVFPQGLLMYVAGCQPGMG